MVTRLFSKAAATAVILAAFSSAAIAQQKVKLSYDVDFETYFDNREFDAGGEEFSQSMTIFGARLTPMVGVCFEEKTQAARLMGDFGLPKLLASTPVASHKLILGVNAFRDFGTHPTAGEYLKEIVMYYDFEKRISRKTSMAMTAGIFPRQKSTGNYSEAFFSDSLKFYDPNFEGILFEFFRPKSQWEIGVDWLGKYGEGSRERFMVFSSGEARLPHSLSIGYAAVMYHFASCPEVWGVVDNVLVNPYACWNPSRRTGFQRLALTLGWLQGAQCDRRNIGKYRYPGGLQLTAEARKWNVGVKNMFIIGDDMMPYYNSCDFAGNKYGSDLYFGDPFYRLSKDAEFYSGPCSYDRLEAYWEPYLSKHIDLKFAALFHFNGKYSGCQQVISLKFNL